MGGGCPKTNPPNPHPFPRAPYAGWGGGNLNHGFLKTRRCLLPGMLRASAMVILSISFADVIAHALRDEVDVARAARCAACRAHCAAIDSRLAGTPEVIGRRWSLATPHGRSLKGGTHVFRFGLLALHRPHADLWQLWWAELFCRRCGRNDYGQFSASSRPYRCVVLPA
jgi:hypothetical protein